MTPALVIAAKDLRQRLRDRSAIVLGFVAPLAIATLMSFAFQGTEQFHAKVGFVDADRASMSVAFGRLLESKDLADVLSVRRFDSEAALAAALRAHTVDAGFSVPAGFTASATGSNPPAISVLTSVDRALAGQVAGSIAQSFVAQVNTDRLAVTAAMAAGATPDQLAVLVASAANLRPPVSIRQRPSGDRSLKPVSYFGPSMGIFFVLFTIGFTARGYFVEQRDGTLERIAAATRPAEVLVGKALSVLVYGLTSLATMAVFTSLVFDADWGGLAPAALLCVSMVVAVVALTMLVIALARSERQAEGFASMITFGLALLGGNFVFVSVEPPLLRRLSLFTPNGWAMRAFVDLSSGPHDLGVAIVPAGAILTFAAAATLVAALVFRRRQAVA